MRYSIFVLPVFLLMMPGLASCGAYGCGLVPGTAIVVRGILVSPGVPLSEVSLSGEFAAEGSAIDTFDFSLSVGDESGEFEATWGTASQGLCQILWVIEIPA